MIKKTIILIVLGGLGYVGYLVWGNLTDREKQVVSSKVSGVADKAKDLAATAADKLTDTAKKTIQKIEQADGSADKKSAGTKPAKSK